jgi:hypothetical protein
MSIIVVLHAGNAGGDFLSFPLNFQSAFQIVMQCKLRGKLQEVPQAFSYIS